MNKKFYTSPDIATLNATYDFFLHAGISNPENHSKVGIGRVFGLLPFLILVVASFSVWLHFL